MSKAQATVDFHAFKHEQMTREEMKSPRLSKSFEQALATVRPMFKEWMIADGVFQANTLVIAKSMSQVYDLYKAENPEGTKIKFARYFDPGIKEDARMRDIMDNATYNRINYLLNKVATRTANGTPQVSPAERAKQRVTTLRRNWRAWLKTAEDGAIPVEDVKAIVYKMLIVVLPESTVEQILAE